MSGWIGFVVGAALIGVLLLSVLYGFMAFATKFHPRSRHNIVALITLRLLSIVSAVACIALGTLAPMYLAFWCGITFTDEVRLICALVGATLGLGSIIIAMRSAVGKEFAQVRIWS